MSLGRLSALVVFAAGLAISGAAQTTASEDRRALLRLEDAWATALVHRDVKTFQRILATGFVYTENDHVSSRDDVLRDITGTDTVHDAHNEDMRVHLFGATGVVTGWLVVRGSNPSGPFDRRYRFTDTWVRRGTSWQIVAAQDYIAPR